MSAQLELEHAIGAVLVPQVRVPGTSASRDALVPSRAYLERFPPQALVAFGRTPAGALSPTPWLAQVRAMCVELGHAAPIACCDLEQGAGLHFVEGTRTPPALALASAALAGGAREELDWIAAAGELTAREARRLGIELVLAPVADVNTRRDNPIVAVRAFADEARAAGERASAFLLGLHAGGTAGCAKHFPGHGDTAQDSHLELPRVARDAQGLRAVELPPFRRLIEHGVECAMVAHLDVPALTGAPGLPCTLSRRAIEDVLRGELGFRGVVVSDALDMGALADFESRYVRALAAGCDALLCPHDPGAAAEEVLAAVLDGSLDRARLEQAAERMRELRSRLAAAPQPPARSPSATVHLADALAERSLRASVDAWPWPRGSPLAVLDALPAAPTPEVAAGVESLRAALGGRREGEWQLAPVTCEARAGRGRYGLTAEEFGELERCLERAASTGRALALAWFGSPQSLPERLWRDPRAAIVLAWAATPPLVAAVARCLAAARPPPRGSLPAALG